MGYRPFDLKSALTTVLLILILPLPAFSAATLNSFSNTNPININNFASATPYPSYIAVSGVTGKITSMQVTLNNLNHTWPDDIGVLLVGPTGEKIVLMDGVGSGTPLVNTKITFADNGSTLSNSTIVSGTYRPTNIDPATNIPFPSPAPAGPYAESFSALNITNPNGLWKLYVRDIWSQSDYGIISDGWQIEFLTLLGTEITVQPRNAIILSGQNATLSVAAITSSGTLNYQWYRGYSGDISAPVAGATSSTYTTPALTNPANYWVRVTGGAGPPVDSSTVKIITTALKGPYTYSSAVTINDNATATPYPSALSVSEVTGAVYGVKVSLANLNHTYSSDIGILLVGPQGQKVVLMDKTGGPNEMVNANLVFSDAGVPLTSNQISSGTYQPTNLVTTAVRTFPAPAPAKPYDTTLAVFNGINPNGTWQLFVRDAADQNGGSITGGWQIEFMTLQGTLITAQPQSNIVSSGQSAILSVGAITGSGTLSYQWYRGTSGEASDPIPGATASTYTTPQLYGPASYWVRVSSSSGPSMNSDTARMVTSTSQGTFTNNTFISIIDNAAANLYPSPINVSGVSGSVAGVRVNLTIVNHANPADIGVLLVGPLGQKVVLMDNAGGVSDISTVNLTFSDSGNPLSANPITSGTYRPTNLTVPMSRTFPAPAPPEIYDTALSVFNGINPNGTWKLYVRDAAKGAYGSIDGGWSLEILAKTNALSVGFAGSGKGMILHQEENLSFNSSYETSVNSGDQVTLVPSADQYSLFTGWTGNSSCSMGACQFIMNSNVAATATFNFDSAHSVLVDAVHQYHAAIDSAYRTATTTSGSTIKLWSTGYVGNLLFDSAKTIMLNGGYNSSYAAQSAGDSSVINGTFRIKAGKLIVSNITIQ